MDKIKGEKKMTIAILIDKQTLVDAYGETYQYKFKFEDETIYTTKKKPSDTKYGWLITSKLGTKVNLVPNTQGKGYYINQIPQNTESNDPYNDLFDKDNFKIDTNINQNEKPINDIVGQKGDLLHKCIIYMHSKLSKNNYFSSEDIRCAGITLFIEINKRT